MRGRISIGSIGVLAAATLLVAACGNDSDGNEDAAGGRGDGGPAETGAGAAEYPLTVETCGREWTYEEAPQRVVSTDTPMLDLMLLLGLDDHIAGYFENDVDNVHPDVVDQARELEHLGDSFPYPSLDAVLTGDPDLVLSYGYNTEAGFTAERLAELGVNNFTVAEGCADHTGPYTIEDYYEDVRTLGRIFDVTDRAEDLIAGWEARVVAVQEDVPTDPVTVLNTGSGDPAVPFASGGTGIAHEMIELAGGENIFADVDEAYFEPSWEEVLDRNPELIVESSGFGQEGLDDMRAYLERDPGLSTMAVMQDGGFLWLRYQEAIPGPQLFTGLEQLADAIGQVRSGG